MGGAVEDRHRERMHERAESCCRALEQFGSQSQDAGESQILDKLGRQAGTRFRRLFVIFVAGVLAAVK